LKGVEVLRSDYLKNWGQDKADNQAQAFVGQQKGGCL
jgi:hypothetical protein